MLQDTLPSSAWMMGETQVGTWLSLVERTLGVGEVASSNLVVPTTYLINQIASEMFACPDTGLDERWDDGHSPVAVMDA